LAQFYMDVFDCKPQYPKRDLEGEWLDKLTNIEKTKIKGIHLILPGYEDGPTLEIFQYEPAIPQVKAQINAQGFGHIAFHVDDVVQVVEKLINCGGTLLGEVVHKELKGVGLLTVAYAKDPEGNYIEIQNWSK